MPQTLHKQEKAQFYKLFVQAQPTDFKDRFAVMEALMQTDGHVSSAQTLKRLNGPGRRLAPEFIRDTSKLMCQYGFAGKQQFDNGEVLCEHNTITTWSATCRKIMEFEDPQGLL